MTTNWNGVCPKCKSTDTEYLDPSRAGNVYEVEFGCQNCGFQWTEVFLIFMNLDKDGNILDDNGNIAENQREDVQYLNWLKEHNRVDEDYEKWRAENG